MADPKDDWVKPRNNGNHLTTLDIRKLKAAYDAGETAREAARSIKCSSRIAYKYFSRFGGEAGRRRAFDPVSHRAERHHRPSFTI